MKASVRNRLLLALFAGVVLVWTAAGASGRLFSTYGYLSDTETSTGNTITAGTLSAPQNLTIGTVTATSVALSWTAPVGGSVAPTGQRVYRATGACPAGGSIPGSATNLTSTPLSGTANSYTDSSVSPSTTYCYYIEAFLLNWTAHSNTAGATTLSLGTTLLLHNDSSTTTGDTMSKTSATNLGTITFKKPDSNTWTYSVPPATTSGTNPYTVYIVQADRPNPSDDVSATIGIKVWWTDSAGSCTTTVPDGTNTLASHSAIVPKVPSNSLNGISFTFTPSGTKVFASGDKLCLRITNNSPQGGESRAVSIVPDTFSVSGVIGVKSSLVIPLSPPP